MTERCRLLAGSVGSERVPPRPDPGRTDWFMPLHVREATAARERLASQLAAGADVIVAPTWLTHRRALLPLGETRRVRAWTAGAVRLARESVERGLERRAEALAEATEVPVDDPRRDRPHPLVAATLPALDEHADPATGPLLAPEAASERDYHDQAGVLAEAEPDLVLVEGQRSEVEARTAIAEAVETGLPVWAALSAGVIIESGIESWLDWAREAGVARLLIPSSHDLRDLVGSSGLPWGALAPERAAVGDQLEAGAGTIGLLDGASPQRLEPYRSAIDDHERARVEAARATERRWSRHVQLAASMAAGGRGLWVGAAPEAPLPRGFEWLVVDEREVRRLPSDRFRLVVVATPAAGGDLTHALERGGLLVGPARQMPPDLRPLVIADEAEPALGVYRREV